MSEAWNIGGGYFEICSCNVTCPCNFLSAPSEGFCEANFGWEIRQGSYGKVDLRGTKVVLIVRSKEHMMKGGWKAALYIDQGASEEQRKALETIFTGKAGGHMAKLVGFVSDFLGVKSVPMKMNFEKNRRGVEIPNILDSEVVAVEGNDGTPVYIENAPLPFWLPTRLTQAKQNKYKYKDYGMEWNWTGKHGIYSNFEWAGP